MLAEEKILNANILIVDDNMLNVQILKKIFNDAGYYKIIFTTDSKKALQVYKDVRPDLVLLDFNMPDLNGIEVMKQLHSIDGEDYLPVLMLTAEEDANLRIQALQSGAKDFLKKPYDRMEVLLRSRNIIEVRLLYTQMKFQNMTLEENVNERTKELYQTRIDVVSRLAKIAEYRDIETGQHIMRMSRYSECLAKAIGLAPAQCDLILNTSPLHDIGKVAVPDHILLKPDKLNVEEFAIMKNHTIWGAQMLAGGDVVFLKMAQIIALTHHEKYDGTGYPNNLKGEDIPLVGRICCLCDVFDALTSIRPYKKAWSVQDARAEIKKGSGTFFEPKLVEAFLDIHKNVQYIYETYQ